MDRIRTLLLARTHIVVMDPDLVASASTRPARDTDAEKLELELAQLGYVMSLDLATMIRRLPYQAVQELRDWMFDTLAKQLGAHRPHVPLFSAFPTGTPSDTYGTFMRRIASWLFTQPQQPCPWCGETKAVGALDPCGHLVCRACWQGAALTGCPICHRRIALGDPFFTFPRSDLRVTQHTGTLTLLHLGLDLLGLARERFERLLARVTPLSPADRDEVETVIDMVGPKAATWLPAQIPIKETMALAIARLWLISPNRDAMMRETAAHVTTATDVLRVAIVLMGGNPGLVDPGSRSTFGSLHVGPLRLASLDRGLRRALLEALEQLPLEDVVEDMRRHRRLWRRVGERLHPFEYANKLPQATLAFAVVRGTNLATASFGAAVRELAVRLPFVVVEDDRIKAVAWAGPIEDALRAGNPRSALARLTHRAGELLRRADHLVRVAQARQLDALQTVIKAIELAAVKGPPAAMLTLASHVARRGRSWPRRVFFPKGEVLHAWGTRDLRMPLRGDAIAVIVGAIRRQLVARAEQKRQFPRAVIDRSLGDLLLPIDERTAARAKLAWPRGSELSLPAGHLLRLFLHWEQPRDVEVDLDLVVELFDEDWRHFATCDADNLFVGDRAAVHSGDLTDAPAPLGATELVDLHFEKLTQLGAKHLVMVVANEGTVPFEKLPHGFAGVMLAPAEGVHFDARAVVQRFDLRGRSRVLVALTIDLNERRMRWLDVHMRSTRAARRATLAHLGRDFADLAAVGARPTLWDIACIHAAARANVIYVRERDGTFTMYRRRDNETKIARLGRLMSGGGDDGKLVAIPKADAPTWFALETGFAMPLGSTGYALDGSGLPPDVERIAAGDLVAELGL